MALLKPSDAQSGNPGPKQLASFEIGGVGSPRPFPGSPLGNFPSAGRYLGGIIYVPNATSFGSPQFGSPVSGSPGSLAGSPRRTGGTIAVSDGTNWVDITTGAVLSAVSNV